MQSLSRLAAVFHGLVLYLAIAGGAGAQQVNREDVFPAPVLLEQLDGALIREAAENVSEAEKVNAMAIGPGGNSLPSCDSKPLRQPGETLEAYRSRKNRWEQLCNAAVSYQRNDDQAD
ncbi:MAG: hypothetical protein RQ899_07580 [Pseudomonadales bacterium]|nr:hypothetical protein [Pseudomonadales bacterium]